MRFGTSLPASFVITFLAAAGAHAGGLGALCDARSPCDDGLSCRDGFCLRLDAPAQPTPPRTQPGFEPKRVDDPTLDPEVDSAEVDSLTDGAATDPAVDGATTDPVVDGATVDPEVDAASTDPVVDAATTDPTEPVGPGGRPPKAPAPVTGAAPQEGASKPDGAAAPGASLERRTPAERVVLAEDAGGQVWGAAGARAIATPALACGGCLLGAGLCTAFGGWQFVTEADAGRFDQFPESNANARIGGFLGLAVGAVASLLGAPLLLVGEGASVYGGFLDVALCGSALGLEDGFLTALGGSHAVAWTLAPQLLGCGSALLGSGAWVWVAANGVNAYPDTDTGARGILYGYQNTAVALMGASTIPLGLGCLLGLAGIGVDIGTVLRAGALRDEALEEAPTARGPDTATSVPALAVVTPRGATIAY